MAALVGRAGEAPGAGEDLPYQCRDLRDYSFLLAFGSPQKWGPLCLRSAVNQLCSLFVPFLVN